MIRKTLFFLGIIVFFTGCQTLNNVIHPSKPLSLPFYGNETSLDIFVFCSEGVGKKVGEGTTYSDVHGEVLLDRTPQDYIEDRLKNLSKTESGKVEKIESCEIVRFSSSYKNETVIWGVYSAVELKISLKDKSEFTIKSETSCKSITPLIGSNLAKKLDEALINCISQIKGKI